MSRAPLSRRVPTATAYVDYSLCDRWGLVAISTTPSTGEMKQMVDRLEGPYQQRLRNKPVNARKLKYMSQITSLSSSLEYVVVIHRRSSIRGTSMKPNWMRTITPSAWAQDDIWLCFRDKSSGIAGAQH